MKCNIFCKSVTLIFPSGHCMCDESMKKKKTSDLFGRRVLLYLSRRHGSSWREWNMHKVIWSAGWRRRRGWRSQRCSFPPCWKGGAKVFSAGSHFLLSAEELYVSNTILNHLLLKSLATIYQNKSAQFLKDLLQTLTLNCDLIPISVSALSTAQDAQVIQSTEWLEPIKQHGVAFPVKTLTAKFTTRISILINFEGLTPKHSTYRRCQELCCKVVRQTGMAPTGQCQGMWVEWSSHTLQKDSRW